MNRPIIKKGDLTYVWQTNAPQKQLTIRGTEITYNSGAPLHFSKTYPNALIGRPAGAEDNNRIFFKIRHSITTPAGGIWISLAPKPATIAENQRSGYVGIYTLK